MDSPVVVISGALTGAAAKPKAKRSKPNFPNSDFSAADITALVTADFAANAMKLPIPVEHTAFQRWYDEVSARPSAAA
jgi:glutathione S-transferase